MGKRTLVWIGAGNANSKPVQLKDFEQSILVEANSEVCQGLDGLSSSLGKVSVINVFIGTNSEPVTFNIANFSELSTSSNIDQLKVHYPGVNFVKSEKVKSLSLTEFLQVQSLSDVDENTLLLDIYSYSQELLEELLGSDFRFFFKRIVVLQSTVPYFKQSSEPLSVESLLSNNNYIELDKIDISEGVYYQSFLRNPLLQQCDSLTAQNTQLSKELNEAISELEDKKKWLNEHEKWNAGLQSEQAEFRRKIAEMEAELELRLKEITDLKIKEGELQELVFKNKKLHVEFDKLEMQLQFLTKFIGS